MDFPILFSVEHHICGFKDTSCITTLGTFAPTQILSVYNYADLCFFLIDTTPRESSAVTKTKIPAKVRAGTGAGV